MAAQLHPNRMVLTDRFPMLGFTIRVGHAPCVAELVIATDPALFTRKDGRTSSTFYTSREDGLLAIPRGEAVFMVPPAVLARFAGADRLWFGLATDRPLLQRVLGSTYPGLDETGWTKLTRNWAFFFGFMALLNEAVWRNSSTDFWIGFKLWGALPLTFLFAAGNIPMLLRHGLMKEDAVPAEPGPVE